MYRNKIKEETGQTHTHPNRQTLSLLDAHGMKRHRMASIKRSEKMVRNRSSYLVVYGHRVLCIESEHEGAGGNIVLVSMSYCIMLYRILSYKNSLCVILSDVIERVI